MEPPAGFIPRLATVFVFNHRFEANVPKLERLYASRFSHRYYLMPFYRGDREDIIPVTHSSFQFQGYFQEAWKRLEHEGFTHFLFTADDLIINPKISETNLLSALKLGPQSGYSKGLDPVGNVSFAWNFSKPSLLNFDLGCGVEWTRELPPPAEATAAIEAKGVKLRRFGRHNFKHLGTPKAWALFTAYWILRLREKRRSPKADLLSPPYPMVVSCSDFVVVPVGAMERFCHLCSIFAAMGVFVEIAIPTALAICCEHVVRQPDTHWRTLDDWTPAERTRFCEERGYEMSRLLDQFAADELYVHPVKLSQWKL